ncbi:hypothetical protein KJ937_00705 [Patescibacteria group bacterium]|nr:hypothetical protein [Patescibacteria group bacterium]
MKHEEHSPSGSFAKARGENKQPEPGPTGMGEWKLEGMGDVRFELEHTKKELKKFEEICRACWEGHDALSHLAFERARMLGWDVVEASMLRKPTKAEAVLLESIHELNDVLRELDEKVNSLEAELKELENQQAVSVG